MKLQVDFVADNKNSMIGAKLAPNDAAIRIGKRSIIEARSITPHELPSRLTAQKTRKAHQTRTGPRRKRILRRRVGAVARPTIEARIPGCSARPRIARHADRRHVRLAMRIGAEALHATGLGR